MRTLLRAGMFTAAIWLDNRLVIVALVAYLAFSAPHLAFHLHHLMGATELERIVLVTVLVASVVLPLLLIALAVSVLRQSRRL